MNEVLDQIRNCWTSLNHEIDRSVDTPSDMREMLMVRTIIRNFSRVGEVINMTLKQVEQARAAIDQPGWTVVHVSILCSHVCFVIIVKI